MAAKHLKNNRRILTNLRLRPDYLEGIELLRSKINKGKTKQEISSRNSIVEEAILIHLNNNLGEKKVSSLEKKWIKKGTDELAK